MKNPPMRHAPREQIDLLYAAWSGGSVEFIKQ